VAIAFDAGNLRPVAEALRCKYPDARLVIAADNDHGTSGNPGLSKAREAAVAVGGSVVAPEFELGETGTDFNDACAVWGAERARAALLRGVEATPAVEVQVVAQAAPAAPAETRAAPAANDAPAPGRKVLKFPDKKPAQKAAVRKSSRDEYSAGFTVDDEAVWFRGRGKGPDEPLEPPFRVCPPLRVLAYLRDTEQENWGLLIEFEDKDSITHRWALPWRMFAAGGDEMRGELLRQGFFVPPSQKARNLFVEYLAQAKPNQHARSVERTGWHGEGAARVFVLPDRTIGQTREPVYFQSESLRDRVYRGAGELADWRTDVADLCRGNSRLVFVVSMAFASMLLHATGEEPGGFHLRGGSSTGKTTALRLAASVFGGLDYLRRWRATDNALEAVAAMHNDALLILDELAQVDPKMAGQAAYMLGNGEGKQRAHRTGSARPVLRWRLLFLSAGEVSLSEHMRQDGKKAQAGQETRLAEIPADAGAGRGLFETLHGHVDAAAFSRALCASAAQHHGTAAPAFIEGVLRHGEKLAEELRSTRADFCKRVLPPKADGQAWRVASRFALVAAAGELASRMGITGWEAGEAEGAARTCFKAWIELRGGAANVEPSRMVAQVRQFLERHGEARFAPWKDDGSNDWITKDRAGFRKPFVQSGSLESADGFYVLRETFRDEICMGFDPRDVARALADIGALERDEKSRKYTKRVRLPRLGNTWCYVILPSIWQGGDASEAAESTHNEGTA
jgi:putative DNA primase/helicase